MASPLPTQRQVVLDAIHFRRPAYVPWAWEMTVDCAAAMKKYLGIDDLVAFVDTHFIDVGSAIAKMEYLDPGHCRDAYGIVWDRTVDKEIGIPHSWPIKDPEDLKDYVWPDVSADSFYADIPRRLAARPGHFSRYCVGFSLYERAWAMRGVTDLLTDMILRPDFVETLLDRIVEHNLIQIRRAVTLPIDAVFFGDDYGMQTGLIMGLDRWRRYFKPRLARMFAPVREAGKPVFLHSCGKVDDLFGDLIEIGLSVFNPFQPEVTDIFAAKRHYHGRLAFHGGMSIQHVLPFGTPAEVREATQRLIEAGQEGGLVISPSHAVPADVPPANLVAMMDVLKSQPGYVGRE
jgi:uroporphyrinogen decarboxylase